MSKYKSLQARLKANSCSCKTKGVSTACRIWSGYSQKDGYPTKGDGYGRINITRNGRSLKFPLHRVAKVLAEILSLHPKFDFYDMKDKQLFFELYDAYSLCGLTIDHLCRNSLCFRPDHLEWVHLTHNQQRKKWTPRESNARIHLIKVGQTRHQRSVASSANVQALIAKIKSKSYRIK